MARALLWGSLLSLWLIPSAWAKPNDIHLHFLYEGKTRELVNNQQRNFRLLSTEFGLALTNPVNSPAETLGIAGFDMGVEFTVADIPELQDRWRRAIEDEQPDNNLFITRFRFRKGLPFSLELDGNIGLIHNSTSWVGGVGLKWALNEGFKYFPDLAVRGGVNRLFSSRDLDLFTVNVDFWISKQFALLGMFTLTPYAGYSIVFMRANSNVLDPTPKNFNDNETPETGNFVFQAENLLAHRFFFGVRMVWFFVSINLEGMFGIPGEGEQDFGAGPTGPQVGPKMVSMFNAKISFFF